MTTVIAVLNQKGGVGKTTFSINLTHGLILHNYKAALIDTDFQQTCIAWQEENGGRLFPVFSMIDSDMPLKLKKIKNDYDVVIIDGASKMEKMTGYIVRSADVVLIPVQPSPFDFWSTANLIHAVKSRQEKFGNLQASFIVSMLIKNTLFAREIFNDLSAYDLPVLNSYTSHLQQYRLSSMTGDTIFGKMIKKSDDHYEFIKKTTKGSIEFNGIIDEVISKYLPQKTMSVAC